MLYNVEWLGIFGEGFPHGSKAVRLQKQSALISRKHMIRYLKVGDGDDRL
jgi:hypothetical protein